MGESTIKSFKFAVSFWGISRMNPAFIFLRCSNWYNTRQQRSVSHYYSVVGCCIANFRG